MGLGALLRHCCGTGSSSGIPVWHWEPLKGTGEGLRAALGCPHVSWGVPMPMPPYLTILPPPPGPAPEVFLHPEDAARRELLLPSLRLRSPGGSAGGRPGAAAVRHAWVPPGRMGVPHPSPLGPSWPPPGPPQMPGSLLGCLGPPWVSPHLAPWVPLAPRVPPQTPESPPPDTWVPPQVQGGLRPQQGGAGGAGVHRVHHRGLPQHGGDTGTGGHGLGVGHGTQGQRGTWSL